MYDVADSSVLATTLCAALGLVAIDTLRSSLLFAAIRSFRSATSVSTPLPCAIGLCWTMPHFTSVAASTVFTAIFTWPCISRIVVMKAVSLIDALFVSYSSIMRSTSQCSSKRPRARSVSSSTSSPAPAIVLTLWMMLSSFDLISCCTVSSTLLLSLTSNRWFKSSMFVFRSSAASLSASSVISATVIIS